MTDGIAYGFALASRRSGKPIVETVAPTERAVMVNALAEIYLGITYAADADEGKIRKAFAANKFEDHEIIAVTITKTERPSE